MSVQPAYAATQVAPGRTFTIPVHARASARAAFREALRSLPLDGLRLRSAFSDTHDRFVEGAFTATWRGAAISGVLLAGTAGVAAAAFDTTDRAPRTIPALLAQLGSHGARPATRPLHAVSFGSGSLALPDSWTVMNSYQGCVEAASRQDHGYLAFGCPQAALAPPLLPGTDARSVLIIASGDPVAVLQRVLTAPSPAGLGVSGVRIAEVRPVAAPMAGGRAAYVLFDYVAGGASFRGLALIAVAGVGDRTFMVYKSMFMLPAATFAQLAPTLWKSWQSWGVNSGVLTSRLTAAAQSMRETGDIITGAYWARQHAGEQTSLGFDQYIRGTAQLEEVNTGRRWNGSYFDAATIVEHDPVNYRIVPTGELSR
ncbi:MAG TPA: hypothetical protein VGU66_14765 [Candidatus Elarobacter sp.]|nr:hypothetical protein [Candidatus Elarobacter sp.]